MFFILFGYNIAKLSAFCIIEYVLQLWLQFKKKFDGCKKNLSNYRG